MFFLQSTLDPKTSLLSSDELPEITISYDSETGIVKTELSREEITSLYRQLPLHTKFHHYELPSSVHLLNVLAACMKYARTEKLEVKKTTIAVSEELKNPIASSSSALDDRLHSLSGDIEEGNDSSLNHWDSHIHFYNTLFPVLDALADLEAIINAFEDKTIVDLQNALVSYKAKMKAIFLDLKNFDNNQRYQTIIAALETQVLTNITRFQKNITDHNKPENTKALLSNHIVKNGIFPLGHFIIEQVERVGVALAQYRRIYEETPGQEDYVEKSSDCQKIDELLENILPFLTSFAGIRFSTQKPIPQSTLKVLRTAGGNYVGLRASKYNVVLNDFISTSEQADSRAWVKLFCQISGHQPPKIETQDAGLALLLNIGLMLVTPIEVGIFFPIRIGLVLIVGIAASFIQLCLNIGNTIGFLNDARFKTYDEKIQDFVSNADVLFNYLYFTCSQVGRLRAQRDANQTLTYTADINDENDADRVNFLSQIAAHRKNSIAYFVKENFRSSYINDGMKQGYHSVLNFFYEAWIHNPSYLGQKSRDYLNKKMGYPNNSKDVLVTLLDDLTLSAPNTELNKEVTLPLNRLWRLLDQIKPEMEYGLEVGGSNKALTPEKHSFSAFYRIQSEKVGPSQSIMDFAELLFIEFALLINNVYIKMPFASSLAMLLAVSAWFYTCAGGVGFVPEVIDWLSKAFTGEGAVDIIRTTLASFLLWKLLTLTIEASIALYKRDADFLEKLYGDPERLFLGFSSCAGFGIILSGAPLLPEAFDLFASGVMNAIFSMYPEVVKHFINAAVSMYPAIANLFIIESRVALEGQLPLTLLEYFFLGLKAIFLFGAIISGVHKLHLAVNEAELEKIIFELNYLSTSSSVDRPQAAYYIFRLYIALGLPIERTLSKHLFDEMSVNKDYFEAAKDLYNQRVFEGSNNLLQILFLLPGVFITYPYRVVMYALAHLLDAPVIKHGIEKNFAEDFTMFIQVAAAFCETLRTFLLGANQLVKSTGAFIAASPLLFDFLLSKLRIPFAISPKLHYSSADFQRFIQNILPFFNMHNNMLWPLRILPSFCLDTQYLNFAKSGYSLLAHTANTDDALEHEESFELLQSAQNARGMTAAQRSASSKKIREQLSPRYDIACEQYELSVNGLKLIRIQGKSGGKNMGSYDGTYVTKAAYASKSYREKTRSSAYNAGEIFFLKMFPKKKKKLVEGFAEALLGKIIIDMRKQGFIDARYHHCFSTATIIQLPDDKGAALLQPFVIGFTELYKINDQSIKAKSAIKDTFYRFKGEGYSHYFKETNEYKEELAYIIMIMILFGNFSVHAGNIMFRRDEANNNKLVLNAIDYGAAFRNFMGALTQGVPVWQSLEELLPRKDGYILKKYLDSYKSISGLFELVCKHAKTLNESFQNTGASKAFDTLITGAFAEVYQSYQTSITNMHGAQAWEEELKPALFNYLTGKEYKKRCEGVSSGTSNVPDADETYFATLISKVVSHRLGQMCSPLALTHLNATASVTSPGTVFHHSEQSNHNAQKFSGCSIS